MGLVASQDKVQHKLCGIVRPTRNVYIPMVFPVEGRFPRGHQELRNQWHLTDHVCASATVPYLFCMTVAGRNKKNLVPARKSKANPRKWFGDKGGRPKNCLCHAGKSRSIPGPVGAVPVLYVCSVSHSRCRGDAAAVCAYSLYPSARSPAALFMECVRSSRHRGNTH